MAEKHTGVYFRPEYFDIVHDINAALLMSQIHYWYMPTDKGKSKLKVYKRGEWWIAKTAKEWWDECRLSSRQVERAISILVEANLIRVEVFKFDGAPTRHIICDALSAISLKERLHFTPKWFSNHLQVKSITDTTTETTADSFCEQEKPLTEKDQTMPTAAEILSNMAAKKQTVPTVVKPNDLVIRWMKHAGAEGQFVKELTGKQKGQLKMFLASAGEKALAALDFAWADWTAFTWEVRKQKGLTALPSKPDIGFLQMYHDVLLQLIAKGSKDIPTSTQVMQPPAPTASNFDKQPKVCDNEEDGKASVEDIDATLAQLEALTKTD